MSNNSHKWLVGGGVGIIIALIIANTFLNQTKNAPPNANQFATNNSSISPEIDQEKVTESLSNITKVEGQKIASVNGNTIELENKEKIVFADAKDINCQVGDIISDYDASKESLVCVRTDLNTGQTNTFYSSLAGSIGGSIAGSLIGNYIASKIFARNNGYEYNNTNRSFRAPNGTVYNPGTDNKYYVNSSQAVNNNFNRSNRGFLGTGLFAGNNNNTPTNDNAKNTDNNSGTKSGSGAHQGSGGVSGTKSGGGGS